MDSYDHAMDPAGPTATGIHWPPALFVWRFFFNIFFYFHEIMTHIQYMMMMMNVQDDYDIKN